MIVQQYCFISLLLFMLRILCLQDSQVCDKINTCVVSLQIVNICGTSEEQLILYTQTIIVTTNNNL